LITTLQSTKQLRHSVQVEQKRKKCKKRKETIETNNPRGKANDNSKPMVSTSKEEYIKNASDYSIFLQMYAENGIDRKPENRDSLTSRHCNSRRESPMSRSVGALRQNDFDSTSCENAKPYSHDPRHSGLPFETGGHAYTTTNKFFLHYQHLLFAGLPFETGGHTTPRPIITRLFFSASSLSALWSPPGCPLKLGVIRHHEH
jgi:hypothetical protein